MRGINDDAVADVLAWCLDRGYELRFIEQMPLDAQHAWDRERWSRRGRSGSGCPSGSRSRRCRRASGGARRPSGSSSTAAPPRSASSPASPSRSARACDRTRLTADGQVRNCLFSRIETDLRGPLRDGATDEELAALIQGEMWRKAPRPRHRRPRLRPAGPPDVRDRRLTQPRGSRGQSGKGSPSGRVLDALSRRTRGSRSGHGLDEEAADREELTEADAGAPRTPARPCGGQRCAAWGCSRGGPRRRADRQPLALQTRACIRARSASGGRGRAAPSRNDHRSGGAPRWRARRRCTAAPQPGRHTSSAPSRW